MCTRGTSRGERRSSDGYPRKWGFRSGKLKHVRLCVDEVLVTPSDNPAKLGLYSDIRDVVLIVVDGRVRETSGPFEALFGFAPNAAVRVPISDVLSHIDGDYEPLLAEATKRRGLPVHSSIRLLGGDRTAWVEVVIRSLDAKWPSSLKRRTGHVVTIRDRTAETELRLQISRLAANDPVTELANPQRFRELVNAALHRSRRTGEHLAILSVHLPTMEAIRAVHEPAEVSAIQLELAKRISSTLRIEDVVGHIEADEFGVVLSGMEPKIGRAYAVDVADRLGAKLAEPVEVAGITVAVNVSIGIAHGNRNNVENTPVDLINEARTARTEVEANADRWNNLKNPS